MPSAAPTAHPPYALVVSGSPVGADTALIARLAEDADFILAVDSGANALMAAGVTPHLLLGDFDSIDPKTLKEYNDKGVALEAHNPHKDATDIELALAAALKRGYRSLVITNALGGRLDHELASLGCFAHTAQQGITVTVMEHHTTCLFLCAPASISFAGCQGDGTVLTPLGCQNSTVPLTPGGKTRPSSYHDISTVSLLPWDGPATVSISGVAWPLDHATLSSAHSLGVSNVPTSPHVTITVHQGTIIAVLT